MHIGLSTLLPELHLQLMFANLLLEQDLFSEHQDLVHVLKYSVFKLDDVINSSPNRHIDSMIYEVSCVILIETAL